MKKFLFILFLNLLFVTISFATHNEGGEITYVHISGFTYEFTITTCTYANAPADRPYLEINWGDGSSDSLKRSNGNGQILGNDVKKNIYIGRHTYNGPGTYTIYVEDPNRNAGIMNIPNSVNQVFYIESKLVINPFLGYNNSPQTQICPCNLFACINNIFTYTPNAYDPDGDSLVYELTQTLGQGGTAISGYTFPPASNSLTINPQTGELIWDSPTQSGSYNIDILIKEYRNGYFIGSVLVDLQINVLSNCSNYPPVFNNLNDLCVEAGTFIQFDVTASDPDTTGPVELTATGNPFLLNVSPAIFNQPVSGNPSVTETFSWQTVCDHVKKTPYQVVFQAEDNGYPSMKNMTTVEITVVGPAPKNPTATPQGNSIFLTWNKSLCPQIIRYDIYRRKGSFAFIPSNCETGVPSYTGFSKIASTFSLTDTTYLDNNNGNGLIPGEQYCYMIVAVYPDGAESYASNEVCAELKKDVPIITNVSVDSTDKNNGKIFVQWAKATELDTIVQHKGPFRYLIYRSNDKYGTNLQLIDSTASFYDTLYNDFSVNTVDNQYSYRIDLYNVAPGNRYRIGYTLIASSIFLNIKTNDKRLNLTWNENVPWENYEYRIFRKAPDSIHFDSLTTVNLNSFTDDSLINGKEYCYYIKSVGKYSSSRLINPIINYSQIVCDTPKDLTAPCPPKLSLIKDCDNAQNFLKWTNPNLTCDSTDDVVKYNIYFSDKWGATFNLLSVVYGSNINEFLHNNLNSSLAGCYKITAIDSVGNESIFSDSVCTDNCPVYELPNVFSPDNNGINDMFKPFPYRYIESIDIKIYNRWGQIVFKSNNPDILWNGKNINTNKDCSEGVYYYVCKVNEKHLKGIESRYITGYIQLLRTSNALKGE